MDSQIQFTVSILMVILFSIAIISFSIGFAIDNDAIMSIQNDTDVSSLDNSMRDSMGEFKSGSQGTYESILETTVEPGSDVVQSNAPFAITPKNLLTSITNIIYLPLKIIFGGRGSQFGIFFTIFTAFLVLLAGLLLYKALRGNP